MGKFLSLLFRRNKEEDEILKEYVCSIKRRQLEFYRHTHMAKHPGKTGSHIGKSFMEIESSFLQPREVQNYIYYYLAMANFHVK